MKKQNLLKLAFTMVAMFVITGAMAQVTYPPTIATNYVEVTEKTLQTTGYGLTLYVAPDPAYSPSYDGTDPADINPTARWTWTVAGTPQGVTTDNYVVITAAQINAITVESDLTVSVVESISGLTCPGSTTTHNITVVGAPTADITAAPVGTWNALVADAVWQTCTDGQSENISIAFTELGVTGGSYAYALDVAVYNYDAMGTESVGTAIERVVLINGTLVGSSTTEAITFGLTTGSSRTKYEVSLRPASIGSAISRISQFRASATAAYSYYDPAATTLTFWVNEPPVTGPIYHIPNNFAAF